MIHKLEDIFQNVALNPDMFHIKEDGVYRWGKRVYRKDQTLEEFLDEHGFTSKCKYPISVYGIFIDENYYCECDAVYDEEQKKWVPQEWQQAIDMHIDDAEDDTVFVGIDYHM